jgi:hypothetical protein
MFMGNKYKVLAGLLIGCWGWMAASRAPSTLQAGVPYPENFRSWTLIKTAVIEKGNPAFAHWGGFHHIYANEKAMAGYRTGRFADGSVIVFDVLEAVEKNNTLEEGERRIVDVMVRDTVRYAATGGWGFEEFNGASKTERLVGDSGKSCFGCHRVREGNGFVFSGYRE